MNKILWFDTETTGLDPISCGIIQLAGIIEMDGVIKQTFNYFMSPLPGDKIFDEALSVHGYDKEQILKFVNPHSTKQVFCDLLSVHCNKFDRNDKFYPAGYNCRFDIEFLSNWFNKQGDKYLGSFVDRRMWLDPLAMVNLLSLDGKLKLVNHKLETVAKHFGVELNAHDALSDIKATRELFYILKKMM